MNRKKLLIFLAAEAAVLLALVFAAGNWPEIFSSLFAFPFEQLGAALGALSLRGSFGNGLALAVWGGVSLAPLAFALGHVGDRTRRWENLSLAVLSLARLAVLRLMARPGSLAAQVPLLGELGAGVIKGAMGCALYSLLALWLILRLLRLFRGGDTARLLEYMRRLLYVLCGLFAGLIALGSGAELAAALKEVQRPLDYFISVLGFLVSALPYVLDISVTISGVSLLERLQAGDREQAENAADKLSRLCCAALGAGAASAAGFNILQLLLLQKLSHISVNVELPVLSLAFVLGALLLARLIGENRRLRDDNELII